MKDSIERIAGAGGFETVVLTTRADDRVEVVPERGALVTRFRSKGEEVLYLDEATLVDRAKNVRGGIPVLFPIAGKLPDGKYAWGGKTYALPQHGFGRNKAWRIASSTLEANGPVLRLALAPDDLTRAAFPFEFDASLTVSLEPGALTVALEGRNTGSDLMPIHMGYHPYFTMPDASKKDAKLDTRATRGFDNRTGKDIEVGKIDFTADELDLHLADHDKPGTRLDRGPGRRPLELAWSKNVKRVVLWTLKGKDFICVEPWTGPGGALANGDPSLVKLGPGESARVEMRIALG